MHRWRNTLVDGETVIQAFPAATRRCHRRASVTRHTTRGAFAAWRAARASGNEVGRTVG
ncbi:hypothetical protein ACFYVR_04740 [Rhodococcus sp. NPDC003318]|uniref:hypothetical protein n=1 Tax=Rhodococcus sp. NPDC003318 TaxID=3364503 RepID=UPI0036CB2F05